MYLEPVEFHLFYSIRFVLKRPCKFVQLIMLKLWIKLVYWVVVG